MTLMKKIIAYILVAMLAVTCIPPLEAAAASTVDYSNIEEEANAGIKGRLEGNISDDFYGTDSVMKFRSVQGWTHNSKFDGWEIQEGIDVSKYQGAIDWEAVRAAGKDFAIIRVAGRGYGDSGTLFYDLTGLTNLKAAKKAGLDVGVYIFSQAITEAEAIEEAKYIVNYIKGYDIDLPIVFDYEYVAGGRLSNAKLTNAQRTNICKAFCDAVESYGYNAMIYANKSMLYNSLNASELSSKYEIWLAHYTKKTDYKGDYTYWQYTSSEETVAGIDGSVDCNFRYIKPGLRILKRTSSTVKMEWTPMENADGYNVYRKTAGTEFELIGTVGNDITEFTDKNLVTNTTYTYDVRGYSIDENEEFIELDVDYDEENAKTVLALTKVTAKAAAVDAGTVKVSWNKEPNAQGYIVQRYNSSTKKYETVKTVTSGSTLYFTNTGLKIGTTYKYRVCPYAKVNGVTKYGNYSSEVSVKTSSALKKPVLKAAQYSYTTNKLSWSKVPGATGYKLQRYDSSKKKWITIKTITSGSTTSYSNTYLNCSTTYKYRVKATATLSGKTVSSYYSETAAVKTKSSRKAVVKNGPLNVRKGPGTSYGKLTKVKKGATVTVTGSTKSWYKIKIKVKGKYKTGYVLKKYVKLK